jgi:adenosine deaminase
VCDDLFDYLRRLDLALEVMQRPADLERVARELVEDLAADGVIHAEVRFAPQLHTRRGLSMHEVLDAVARGLSDGGPAHSVTTAHRVLPAPSRGRGGPAGGPAGGRHAGVVCALDLARDEGNFPAAEPHIPARRGRPACGSRRMPVRTRGLSVREVLDLLGAERIGHGVRVEEERRWSSASPARASRSTCVRAPTCRRERSRRWTATRSTACSGAASPCAPTAAPRPIPA